MTTLSKSDLFPAKVVADLINQVKGKSSLAKLSQQNPIPFNGQKEFIFKMDSEIDIVAENGKKSHGGISLDPVTIIPIKVEYGARVSDEFLYGADEQKIDILQNFVEGYANKLARGFDLMAFHGINPRTGQASPVIGENNFDSKTKQVIPFDKETPDYSIEQAIQLIQSTDRDISSLAMSREFSNSLATMKTWTDNNVDKYPELAWGASPATINNLPIDINNTVSNGSDKLAIVGDFANMFKWGYAKEIVFEVIKYGDPDNSGQDLKGYNQVYLRAESYIGWAIMDGDSFAYVAKEENLPAS